MNEDILNRDDKDPWAIFPDGSPPEAVIAGWRAFMNMPRLALGNIWPLITSALTDPDNPDNRQLVQNFAERFDASPGNVLAAVRACDFVLRQSASLGLVDYAVRADLERLSGGESDATEILMSQFDSIQGQLRIKLLEDTLADHGNVLTAFDWRVDKVDTSNHGRVSELVVFLNLRYRNGDDKKRLSLQLPPTAIAGLKSFLNQIEEVRAPDPIDDSKWSN